MVLTAVATFSASTQHIEVLIGGIGTRPRPYGGGVPGRPRLAPALLVGSIATQFQADTRVDKPSAVAAFDVAMARYITT